jgi:hypothetical protein
VVSLADEIRQFVGGKVQDHVEESLLDHLFHGFAAYPVGVKGDHLHAIIFQQRFTYRDRPHRISIGRHGNPERLIQDFASALLRWRQKIAVEVLVPALTWTRISGRQFIGAEVEL